MSKERLTALYRGYIDCLNRQDWPAIGEFVHEGVERNGEPLGLAGYVAMLEKNYADIPDLAFEIALLASDPPLIACRLWFDCTPRGELFGLPVNGRKVSFYENVFYELDDEKIRLVWSVIDIPAIEAQL
ncbi:MAG: ester cyclase [Acidisphaera sp.]|nr:ester cyclase [Acidisphaera sp.]MBV9813732.1 ester cyclase [Acetobacteraceae bacterium]